MGNQIALLAGDGVQQAGLHLHPQEMGPITVQITLDGQAAQVNLTAENAQTRQALEQAMPNLASSLRESGLTLTGGGVFDQPRQARDQAQAQGAFSNAGKAGRDLRAEGGSTGAAVPLARLIRRQGAVDLYA